jgi:SAM-dependent methyltransferase
MGHKGSVSRVDWLFECPMAARPALEAYVIGEGAAGIALLPLLMAASSAAEIQQVLERATKVARESAVPEAARRLEQLCSLIVEHPEAWQLVATTLQQVDGGSSTGAGWNAPALSVDETDSATASRLADLAERFDRAAQRHPEASVALYSLGDPALLAAASAELVQLLRDWALLRREWRYLDIGCGIGRIEQMLSPEVHFITGIDIAPTMIELARARCAEANNVAFRLASGRDLDGFADASIDVILAVDSFPYLVRCGALLVERHLSEAVRVLKPGGQVAIFNFSYGGDLAADRAELERLARRVGLTLVRNGVRGLRTWDSAGFHLVK